jgi:hypothetical protein
MAAKFRQAAELVERPQGRLILRPNPSNLRTYLKASLGGIPVLGLLILTGLLSMPWWSLGFEVIGLFTLIAMVYRALLWMEVTELTANSLLTRTWRGRSGTPRSAIRKVVFVRVSTGQNLLHYMLFIGEGNRCLA